MTDKPTKKTKTATTKGKAAPVKTRTDWEAVERDYRTAKFTLRELAAKYACTHQAIGNQIKRHSWTQDLSVAIKQATDTKLVNDLVAKSGQDVANTVLAAAEVNSRIILGHRIRLVDLASAVDTAKEKLLILGDSVADIREAATFVQAVGNLATATKTLIEQERKAHNLDVVQPKPESEVSTLLQSLGPRSAFQVVK